MSDYRYERLTALDNSFLVLESHDTPMHVASVAIFEAEPLRSKAGGIDIERITAHVESHLHQLPRYREKLAYIPVEGHPVWVDDPRFNLHYHIRHTSLPNPGTERQLKRTCARIMSQELDRGKPLWETWIIEGLEGDRCAMISKVHHCMIDGVSGVDLLTVLLGTRPQGTISDPVRWVPRPEPSRLELLRDEIVARAVKPVALAAGLLRQPVRTVSVVGEALGALAQTFRAGLHLASVTPFNQPIGSHRRFDLTTTDIAAIQEIRQGLGGTLNDVVLATVAGAVRHFFERRGLQEHQFDFRAFVPVSLRTADEHGTLGNRVAGWIVDLPIGESDAPRRIAAVREATAHLKASGLARGTEILTEATEWIGSTLLNVGARLAFQATPFNLVVTNVPGPPQPLYLLGARMLEAYPMVPLNMNLGLGIALFSNAGRLFWGFNADWDVVPDLHDFVDAINASFTELLTAARNADVRKVKPGRKVGAGPKANGGAVRVETSIQ